MDVISVKTSEKHIQVDEETASYLESLDKMQKFEEEQFDKHQVLVETEYNNPCNIWIVCERSKINNATQKLTSFIDENKIASSIFETMDPMKVRFLKDNCWELIKMKANAFRSEGVKVFDRASNWLEVIGTLAGRKELLFYLGKCAARVVDKVCT